MNENPKPAKTTDAPPTAPALVREHEKRHTDAALAEPPEPPTPNDLPGLPPR